MASPNHLSRPAPKLWQADDWETRTLNRAAARVEDLPPAPAEAEDFGWEEGVLERLRQRLNATE